MEFDRMVRVEGIFGKTRVTMPMAGGDLLSGWYEGDEGEPKGARRVDPRPPAEAWAPPLRIPL